jgi:hypothetical protein
MFSIIVCLFIIITIDNNFFLSFHFSLSLTHSHSTPLALVLAFKRHSKLVVYNHAHNIIVIKKRARGFKENFLLAVYECSFFPYFLLSFFFFPSTMLFLFA